MFSHSLGQALVRPTSRHPAPSLAVACISATGCRSARSPSLQCDHQRRYVQLTRKKPRDPARAASTSRAASASQAKKLASARSLPAVPPTSYMNPTDVRLSSFFSLHRPISVSVSVPKPGAGVAFDSIFDLKPRSKTRQPQEVVDTLTNAVSRLEDISALPVEEEEIWDGESDAEPGILSAPSIENLIGKMRPFRAPPVPGALQASADDQTSEATESSSTQDLDQSTTQGTEDQNRTWSITVDMTETTTPTGDKIIVARMKPPGEVHPPITRKFRFREQDVDQAASEGGSHFSANGQGVRVEELESQPMGTVEELSEVIGDRPPAKRRSMLAISVKRQRRLKMKKHKYKKLMDRTRNLRKKLDKA